MKTHQHGLWELSTSLLLAAAAAVMLRAHASSDHFGAGDDAFTIEFVPIGSPGNPADATSRLKSAGSVSYEYRMGKYEVSREMIEQANRGGGLGITLSDMSSYGGNHLHRPATGVTWVEAATFVNWLNTSTGHHAAYDLTGGNLNLWSPGDAWQWGGENLYRHKDAYYFLPSEHEWYKAAYYDAAAGMYYRFPTGSDAIPAAVAGGTTAGSAVYSQPVAQGPADIMSAGGLSPYGTMGQGGNVWEWVESALDGMNDSILEHRGTRGGTWYNPASQLVSSLRTSLIDPAGEYHGLGFRVAAIPGGNEKPVLQPLADTVVTPGGLLEVILAATDPDVPANQLTYRLVSGPPGAVVEGNVFRWQTQAVDAGQVHQAIVQVTDDGEPPLSDQGSFRISVGPDMHWETRDSGAGVTLNGVTWGKDRFVAVGDGGKIFTSPDGLSWEQQASPTTRVLLGMTYGADRFVAMGEGGVLLTSADGLAWQSVNSGSTFWLADGAYGNGRFAAVGWWILISDSEATWWRPGAVPTTKAFYDVSYGRGRFLASGTDGLVASLDTGTQWVLHDAGTTSLLTASGYGFEQWWVGGARGELRASANLTEWRAVDSGATDPIASLCYGDGRMLAVGGPDHGVTGGFVQLTRDGESWERAPTGEIPSLHDVAFNGQSFVAVGEGGVIVRSTSLRPAWSLQVIVEGQGVVTRNPERESYADGTAVILTATPAAGWAFGEWSGALTGTANPTSLTMTAPCSVRASFVVSNRAPTLAAVGEQAMAEGEQLQLALQATDPDLPTQPLTYELIHGPPGATVDQASGVLQWQPGEADGGQVHGFEVRVADNGDPPLSDTKAFNVKVREVNLAPVLLAVGDQSVLPGDTLVALLNATDADLPPNQLEFTLEEGPSDATLESSAGRFVWTATEPLGTTVQRVRIRVSDNGEPPLSDEVEFAIQVEGQPPVVTFASPASGATDDERVILAGTVTDNIAVGDVRWERDGVELGALRLSEGGFQIAGLLLHPGENRFRVMARDHAGNATTNEVVATWEPLRTLATLDAVEVPEGQRATVPVQFTSRGDVASLTFLLQYDSEVLRDPELVWDAAVGEASASVDAAKSGEVRARLSLVGGAIPTGSHPLAWVSFRARSVPAPVVTPVTPVVVSVADPEGVEFSYGTDAVTGGVRVRPRRIPGDSNGNDRLDVGDAVLAQRLWHGLDELRAWDVTGNDLDRTGELDGNDVTRILRVVVGLDPSPTGTMERRASHPVMRQGGAEAEPAHVIITLPSMHGRIGEVVTCELVLTNASSPVAGARVQLEYPVAALRLLDATALAAGPLVPMEAAGIWHVSSAGEDDGAWNGVVSFAASSPTPWPQVEGVLARLSFVVEAGATQRTAWELRVAEAELTPDGYDVLALQPTGTTFQPWAPTPPEMLPAVSGMTEQGFVLSFIATPGGEYVVEASEDLQVWTTLGTTRTDDGPARVVDPVPPTHSRRFYRVRVAE